MRSKTRKKKVPQLQFTKLRNIGWHVTFRDPATGTPRKHRFDASSRGEAEKQYHQWVAAYLEGMLPEKAPRRRRQLVDQDAHEKQDAIESDMVQGSLLHVTSGLLCFEKARVRSEGEGRRKGTISQGLYSDRKLYSKEFLAFLNSRHGESAVRSMPAADLAMEDVEAYNRALVESGYSSSQVSKRLRFVKAIINRAGRPEYGNQAIVWNWAARDVIHGKPAQHRKLPTLKQLKLILRNCEVRESAIVWLAIGCGFGQRDVAAIRINHIDKKSYDLRRGKTGIDRYGETPKLVWNTVGKYLKTVDRQSDDLMFITRKGMPLVHGNSDAVVQWWTRLRKRLGEQCRDLDGFYILRHLGATEFGSRPSCSIGAVKRWLGHSASSQVADVYMKPVSPENRPVVEWVRKCLASGRAELGVVKKKKKQ